MRREWERPPSAASMSRTISARKLSLGAAVARMVRDPVRLSVPARSPAPGVTDSGTLSPVDSDASLSDRARKSVVSGKGVEARFDLGCARIFIKKHANTYTQTSH